jgi:hypothetical protein
MGRTGASIIFKERCIKMGTIIDALRNLDVGAEDYVYLNYEDRADVWHIADDYIDVALGDTDTAEVLARSLATPGVTVFSRYGEDILGNMRDEGMLDDYDREGWFEEYLCDKIREEAYNYDLLTISTERHDHKRGTCEVASNVKVAAADLYGLGEDADGFVRGFDVVVQTEHGSLTLG